jgi:hypothetical protein
MPDISRFVQAQRRKNRAEECRAITDHLTDARARQQMSRLADGCERLGVAAE